MWGRTGTPATAQFDNHSILRGGIPPAARHFGPVVATCLQLGVVPRFIPLREPWRNGVVEHFNDVWDKSFFRTETFTSRDHLARENAAFIAFHNATTATPPTAAARPMRSGPTGSATACPTPSPRPTGCPPRGQDRGRALHPL